MYYLVAVAAVQQWDIYWAASKQPVSEVHVLEAEEIGICVRIVLAR